MEYNLRKSIVLSLKLPGLSHISQFLTIPHDTLHFSQKCLKDRLLLPTEKIVLKKSHIYLSFDFCDQVSESWDFQKILEGFLCETFSIGWSNQRIPKTNVQTNTIFWTCFLSFFLFLPKEFWWCLNYFITCCILSIGERIFLYIKTSRQCMSGETDSIYGRKHWVPHQHFQTNQASLIVAKLQISFYFLKLFEKPLSVKPFGSLINNLLLLKSHNWSELSYFLAASKNLHQDS